MQFWRKIWAGHFRRRHVNMVDLCWKVYTRLPKRWHPISLIHERQDPTPLWEMFAQIHNQWFTSLIIHGKILSHDKTFSSGKVWIALIIHYVQLMVIINACCVSTFLQSSVLQLRKISHPTQSPDLVFSWSCLLCSLYSERDYGMVWR